MSERLGEVTAITRAAAAAAAKDVLMSAVTQHYSEADIETMSSQIAAGVVQYLRTDPRLTDLVLRGDISSANGTINGPGIVLALQQAESRCKTPSQLAMLRHLTSNFESMMSKVPPVFTR